MIVGHTPQEDGMMKRLCGGCSKHTASSPAQNSAFECRARSISISPSWRSRLAGLLHLVLLSRVRITEILKVHMIQPLRRNSKLFSDETGHGVGWAVGELDLAHDGTILASLGWHTKSL